MSYVEKTINSQAVFVGKVLEVYKDTIELPNGSISYREIVRHRGASAILIIDEAQNTYICKQYRYAIGKDLLEIPAGKIDVGGNFLETAYRETEEETGFKPKSLVSLGLMYPTCGYSNEAIALYLATDFEKTTAHLDEDEFLDIIVMPFDELLAKVMSGEIEDAKTIVAVLKYKQMKDSGLL